MCRIGDATSETLLRTAHLLCLVNSDHFSVLGADEDCYGAHKRIMSCLLHIQVGKSGSSIGWCCIGDATSETLLRTAHFPCWVNSEAIFHFSVFNADEDCYGAYKRIMSRLLHIQVGTNGSSIGVCRIGDDTSETLWKMALSRGLRRARLFLGVWSRQRPLWCIHAYLQSPTTGIR